MRAQEDASFEKTGSEQAGASLNAAHPKLVLLAISQAAAAFGENHVRPGSESEKIGQDSRRADVPVASRPHTCTCGLEKRNCGKET